MAAMAAGTPKRLWGADRRDGVDRCVPWLVMAQVMWWHGQFCGRTSQKGWQGIMRWGEVWNHASQG